MSLLDFGGWQWLVCFRILDSSLVSIVENYREFLYSSEVPRPPSKYTQWLISRLTEYLRNGGAILTTSNSKRTATGIEIKSETFIDLSEFSENY